MYQMCIPFYLFVAIKVVVSKKMMKRYRLDVSLWLVLCCIDIHSICSKFLPVYMVFEFESILPTNVTTSF